MARLFVLCMLTYALLFTGGSSNTITRVGLAQSVVERGTLTVDRVAPLTVDKAAAGGHFYLDKAPGLSFLAVPAVWAVTRVLGVVRPGMATDVGADGALTAGFYAVTYAATLAVVGVLAAGAVAAVYGWGVRRGVSHGGALFGAVALGFGTPFLGWSTIFFGHAAAGALLLLGFLLLRGAAGMWRGAAAGAVLGAAFVVEFPAGPAVAILGGVGFVAALAERMPVPRVARVFGGAALGLAAALAPLLAYDAAAFGSPFRLGYGAVVDWPGMQRGVFGLTAPDVEVAWALLFGWYRGLLPLAPVLVFVPVGAVLLWRRGERVAVAAAALVAVYYVCMNASYFYWDGGWSTGPRHVVPMLPLLCLLLAPVWGWAGRMRWAVGAVLGASVAASACCALTTVTAPDLGSGLAGAGRPFWDIVLPMVAGGDFHRLVTARFPGGNGLAGLVPLAAVWIVVGVPLAWRRRFRTQVS